ncbi:MAG TPA: glycosyltransferase family 39 protein, partial [Vicinamibacteria bacterium]
MVDGLAAMLRAMLARDLVVLGALLGLAAVLRFVGLEARGRFDGDQGHDVLVLLRLVRDGTLPLLGPPTSIGDFHHGAAYYFLLAPVAWLSGANPTAIVAFIAALGVAAVGATWWFARMVGGPAAGAIAGLFMAVSPAAIEESTFIWNPNPIPLFAALALGWAWRAHQTGATRWWVAAIVASGVVFQLHVLGIVFIPPILALAIADGVRATRSGDRARAWAIAQAAVAGLLLVALLFVPLLVHELGSGFEETRHVLDYIAGGGSGRETALDPFVQAMVTLFRVIGWPLVGLVTDAPGAAIAAVSVTVALGAWLAIAGRGTDRTVARWLGLTIAWSGIALTIVAPSLQTVVEGLPNDHYHAYLDPVV